MRPALKAFERFARPLTGLVNRARLGFPRHCFNGAGGIGDDLLCTAVFRELRKRQARGIVFRTVRPDLFRHNLDLDAVLSCPRPTLGEWLREGLPFRTLSYAHYNPATDRDEFPPEHMLAALCRAAGITGVISLRPYLFLDAEEFAAGRLGARQLVFQSSARSAAHAFANKEWFLEGFQAVCDHFRGSHTLVQIGSPSDPPIEGATDLRGQTSLRQSAAIIANASVFIGLEGFLTHLARAVDTRAVSIHGGRPRSWQIGYLANVNLVGEPPCSPCWQRSRCDYERVCMQMISPTAVIDAVELQLSRWQTPLETETWEL